jgi:hypothetical protein
MLERLANSRLKAPSEQNQSRIHLTGRFVSSAASTIYPAPEF